MWSRSTPSAKNLMGEVVNLRIHRKRKAKADRERSAAENRLRHGRTRAEREAHAEASARETARHDGHRLQADDKTR